MFNPLVGHDEAVANWVALKIGSPIVPPYSAIGWLDQTGTLRVGFVFHTYIPNGNVDFALAASGRLTRGMFAAVADYAFNALRASRLTARAKRSNVRACKMLRRAGFMQESICKAYYEDDDAVQFRMLRENCRWLK